MEANVVDGLPMIPQKLMEVVQMDYVVCVPEDEAANYNTTGESAQGRIVAAKQTLLFEADSTKAGKNSSNAKKQPLSQRKPSGPGTGKSLINRYHGGKDAPFQQIRNRNNKVTQSVNEPGFKTYKASKNSTPHKVLDSKNTSNQKQNKIKNKDMFRSQV